MNFTDDDNERNNARLTANITNWVSQCQNVPILDFIEASNQHPAFYRSDVAQPTVSVKYHIQRLAHLKLTWGLPTVFYY